MGRPIPAHDCGHLTQISSLAASKAGTPRSAQICSKRLIQERDGVKAMKVYVISLGAGILVGIIYSALSVRSPAPPIIALIGLFGILIGEQMLPIIKHIIRGHGLAESIGRADCESHVLGQLPANCEISRGRPRMEQGDR
jgi:XapX domain-containing protein